MGIYTEELKELKDRLFEIIQRFSKVTKYKTCIRESLAFLLKSNSQLEITVEKSLINSTGFQSQKHTVPMNENKKKSENFLIKKINHD